MAGLDVPTDRRPLTARSVIASTLLGVDPPRLPTTALVHSGELFGLRAGATRTALSRMASVGEVVADDGGYRLAGELLDRHARQQDARRSSVRAWDGTWELAIVRIDRRPAAQRALLREAARARKLVEVREGCWARPANLDPARAPSAAQEVAAQCTLVAGARPDDPCAWLAVFPTSVWADTARGLVAEMDRWQPALDDADVAALGPTFAVAAHVLRLLVADPALPAELQSAGWPAADLRTRFERFDRAFKQTWRSWYRGFRDD